MKHCLILLILFMGIYINSNAQSWEAVGGGADRFNNIDDPVQTMYAFHGKLYIGGRFLSSSKMILNNLACWNGKKIDMVGKGLDSIISTLTEYKDELCMGGGFNKKNRNSKSYSNIVLWKDSIDSWNDMAGGIDGCNVCEAKRKVFSLCVYRGDLYAGGGFSKAGGTDANSIARWDGTKWLKVGEGNTGNERWTKGAGVYGMIFALMVYRDKLYMGGQFNNVDGKYMESIVCWNGKKFERVSQGINKGNDFQVDGYIHDYKINTLGVYNGELYAGGYFDSIGGKRIYNIAKWNDTTWSPLGLGIKGRVNTLIEFNGKLYAGGEFDSAGGKPALNIAVWDGKNWSAVAEGLIFHGKNRFNGRIRTLAVYNNELYAGGLFDSSGDVKLNNLARLNLKNNLKIPVNKK